MQIAKAQVRHFRLDGALLAGSVRSHRLAKRLKIAGPNEAVALDDAKTTRRTIKAIMNRNGDRTSRNDERCQRNRLGRSDRLVGERRNFFAIFRGIVECAVQDFLAAVIKYTIRWIRHESADRAREVNHGATGLRLKSSNR